MSRSIRYGFLSCAILLTSLNVSGQIFLVESVSYSVFGEPVATHLFTLDGAAGRIVPGGTEFTGYKPAGPPQLVEEGQRALVSLQRSVDPPEQNAIQRLVAIETSPVRRLALVSPELNLSVDTPPRWYLNTQPSHSDNPTIHLVGYRNKDNTRVAFPFEVGASFTDTLLLQEQRDPFVLSPSTLNWNPSLDATLVLNTDGLFLKLLDVELGESFSSRLLGEGLFEESFKTSAVIRESKEVLVAASRFSSETGRITTSIWSIRLDPLESIRQPIELKGDISQDHIVGWGPSNWLITTEEALGHTRYLYHLRFDSDGVHVVSEYLLNALNGPKPLVDLSGERAWIADAERLIRLDSNGASKIVARFEQPLSGLARHENQLFVAEGSAIHQLNERYEIVHTTYVPRGRVEYLVSLPSSVRHSEDVDLDGLLDADEARWNSDPNNPDTDHDEIPDGFDTRPNFPHSGPRPNFPETLTIQSDWGPPTTWRPGKHLAIDSIQNAVPQMPIPSWLRAESIYANDVENTGVLLSTRITPNTSSLGKTTELLVRIQDIYTHRIHGGGAWPIRVETSAPARKIRRIGWLLSSAHQAESLQRGTLWAEQIQRLSSYPHHFSHEFLRKPNDPALSELDVLVIDAKIAATGLLTRRELREFLRAGKGAFILVDMSNPIDTTLRFWLEALGGSIVTVSSNSTTLVNPDRHPLTHRWPDRIRVPQRYLRFDRDVTSLVMDSSDPTSHLLAEQIVGTGRAVFLAMSSSSLNAFSDPAWLGSVIEYLAMTPEQILDVDQDGLADRLEDRNASGFWEPGETDFTVADTDHDGVLDGVEDWNGNGRWDFGETHPLNSDTDGDGIIDGADWTPLPRTGDPTLASVAPAQGAAEGGELIELHGMHLPAGSAVWFGGRKADWVRSVSESTLVARVPEIPSGQRPGPVDIRLGPEHDSTQTILPGAYTYGERSRVELQWREIRSIARVYDGYAGQIALAMNAPDVPLDTLEFWVTVEPGGVLTATDWRSSQMLESARVGLDIHPGPGQTYRVRLTGTSLQNARFPIAFFDYRADFKDAVSDSIRFHIRVPNARNPFGGRLETSTPTLELPLAQAGSRDSP